MGFKSKHYDTPKWNGVLDFDPHSGKAMKDLSRLQRVFVRILDYVSLLQPCSSSDNLIALSDSRERKLERLFQRFRLFQPNAKPHQTRLTTILRRPVQLREMRQDHKRRAEREIRAQTRALLREQVIVERRGVFHTVESTAQ